MITKGDKIVFALIILLAIGAFFFLRNRKAASAASKDPVIEEKKDGKGNKKKKKDKEQADSRLTVSRKWDMPADLKEISGIAWMGDGRFACVQDELGSIFIYSTAAGKVEKIIPFGAAGDYEGIAVDGSTAYVVRADGKLFEVKGFNGGSRPVVVQHGTHLTARQDIESLCLDKKRNRLLLGIKGDEPDTKEYKGIYAFDLASKKLAPGPVYKIALDGGTDKKGKGKNRVQPSDHDIHPLTGDLYIVDGPGSGLLVMGSDGQIGERYELAEKDFPQPEGISFSPEGDLYISNEGKTGTGNILQVAIREAP